MNDAPRILGGRYEVGDLIGRGGMAEVHIAHDTRLGRTVAIKVLRSDLARDPSFQTRFRREAQAAAALNHPAIVAVYDTGEDVTTDYAGNEQHIPFIVMEYVEGHTVREILRGGQPVPIDEAIEITSGVLSALEYSHRAGIVHRDIKPGNVMITPTGTVKVMDFGIARAVADAGQTVTQTQAVIGTAQYLSPEQARGETVDGRSDLYSTGCLLYELLTGRPPFIGDSPVSVAYQHVREEAPPPSSIASDVPDQLDRVVVKALAKDRDLRYRSAEEFRADLDNFSAGRPVSAPAVGLLAAGASNLTEAMGPAAGYPADATQVVSPDAMGTQVMSAQEAAAATSTQTPPAWAAVAGDAASTGTLQATPDEEEPKKSKKWLMWTLIGVGAAIVIGLILFFTLGNKPAQVAVPPLTSDMTSAQAKQAVEGAKLVYSEKQASSETVEKDHVISSDPKSGDMVKEGSTVTVTISTGASSGTMPDLTNKTPAEAQKALDALNMGLTLDSTASGLENSKDIPKDKITKTEPTTGDSVTQGQKVKYWVSSGMVTVKDYTGQKCTDVNTDLQEQLGLVANTNNEPSTSQAAGTVISTDPGPGDVPQGSKITINCAQTPTSGEIPDVTGYTASAAQAAIQAAGFQTKTVEQASDSVPKGNVISTDPPAGEQALGVTVTIYVSSGPASGSTPTPTPSGTPTP